MIRATTNGVLKNYRSGLNRSFTKLNDARTTMLTHRNFNSYAEDPAAAAKAFQLRRSRMTAEAQLTTCDDSLRKYQSAWSCLDTVSKLIDTENGTKMATLKGTTLQALNDPTGDARAILGQALDQLSETIVQTMNQKYADNFIFSGADGQTVPFEVKDSKLYYRGIPVDASVPDVRMNGDAPVALKLNANGEYDPTGTDTYLLRGKSSLVAYNPADPTAVPDGAVKNAAGDAVIFKADGTAYADMTEVNNALNNGEACNFVVIEDGGTISPADYEQEKSDAEKLQYLSGEKYFVDIGLGNKENEEGQLIETSAFNAALHAINFLGYGKDADGDPKNVYSLVQKMKDIAGRIKDGEDWTDADYDEFYGLVQKLEITSDEFKKGYTAQSAATTKLENNSKLLTDNIDTLIQQYAGIEDVDDAEAITAFLWAQYSYNAALRVGNSVLSQSLMDYLQ